jgi:hypothetical protein
MFANILNTFFSFLPIVFISKHAIHNWFYTLIDNWRRNTQSVRNKVIHKKYVFPVTSRSRTVRFGRNKELVLTNKQTKFCEKLLFLRDIPQGFAVIFSHHQVYAKRKGRTLFLLPKVKVEFRHLFSLQKRFSLCSYHNINANIVVFADWLVYSGITLVLKFQAVWTTSYHTQFRFIWT